MGIYFVTGQKRNPRYVSLEGFNVPDRVNDAVLKDEKITLTNSGDNEFNLQKIASNNYELEADKITDIYKNRREDGHIPI